MFADDGARVAASPERRVDVDCELPAPEERQHLVEQHGHVRLVPGGLCVLRFGCVSSDARCSSRGVAAGRPARRGKGAMVFH